MTALKSSEIDAYLARPDARAVALVFGPDAGLVAERADALIAKSVDDLNDPFALVRLDGDELAADPARLVDEALSIPMFGGRRAIRVKAGNRNLVPALEAVLALPLQDCRIVIEAGDLKRNAALRAVCERAKGVVAIPCYADAERDLARLVDDELKAEGLAISAEARAALIALLGGDRRASRSELRKLGLYARGRQRVELADVRAVISDAASLELDALIDAAFAGRANEVETEFARVVAAGTSLSSVVFAALRQVGVLHRARVAIESGTPAGAQLEQMYVHFSRKADVEAALRAWTAPRLERAMAQLADAQLESRRQAALAEPIVMRALMWVAMNGKRRA